MKPLSLTCRKFQQVASFSSSSTFSIHFFVFYSLLLGLFEIYAYFCSERNEIRMSHDISQPIPQGSNGAQDAENSRIAEITDELERLCAVHETQFGDSHPNGGRFESEQRIAEQMAKAHIG